MDAVLEHISRTYLDVVEPEPVDAVDNDRSVIGMDKVFYNSESDYLDWSQVSNQGLGELENDCAKDGWQELLARYRVVQFRCRCACCLW